MATVTGNGAPKHKQQERATQNGDGPDTAHKKGIAEGYLEVGPIQISSLKESQGDTNTHQPTDPGTISVSPYWAQILAYVVQFSVAPSPPQPLSTKALVRADLGCCSCYLAVVVVVVVTVGSIGSIGSSGSIGSLDPLAQLD